MTFYVNFPPEVIAATQEAAAVAEEGITVEPDVDLAEKVIIVKFIRDANFGLFHFTRNILYIIRIYESILDEFKL